MLPRDKFIVNMQIDTIILVNTPLLWSFQILYYEFRVRIKSNSVGAAFYKIPLMQSVNHYVQ